jgi:hypothetical protein
MGLWEQDVDIYLFSGAGLHETDQDDPWYISFDRAVPGVKGDLVVAAIWITLMKVDLGRVEFGPVVDGLADSMEKGEVFVRGITDFPYWDRRADGE